MLEFRTQGFQGYAVKYSPFFDNRIAVAASANYGLVGNGRLYILELTPNGIQALKRYANPASQLQTFASGAHLTASVIPPKMLSTTSHIPKPTPFMSSHPPATAHYDFMTHHWHPTFPLLPFKNIPEKHIPAHGTSPPKRHLHRHHGTAQSRSGTLKDNRVC